MKFDASIYSLQKPVVDVRKEMKATQSKAKQRVAREKLLLLTGFHPSDQILRLGRLSTGEIRGLSEVILGPIHSVTDIVLNSAEDRVSQSASERASERRRRTAPSRWWHTTAHQVEGG